MREVADRGRIVERFVEQSSFETRLVDARMIAVEMKVLNLNGDACRPFCRWVLCVRVRQRERRG